MWGGGMVCVCECVPYVCAGMGWVGLRKVEAQSRHGLRCRLPAHTSADQRICNAELVLFPTYGCAVVVWYHRHHIHCGQASALLYVCVYVRVPLQEFAGDPATSPTAPHIVTRVIPGVVYVGNPAKHSKAGDHGGLNDDDNHVALLVSK